MNSLYTHIFVFLTYLTAMVGLGPPFRTLTRSDYLQLEDSINFVSVKILESDVGYPISVLGTILARDQLDYKRIYLFKCFRDSPQVIQSPVSICLSTHLLTCLLDYICIWKEGMECHGS